MVRWSILSAVMACCLVTAHAEMQKIATVCPSGVCFHWWPILPSVEGWRHDRDASLSNGFNAQVPVTSNFADAEALIYAIAPYKPRMPNIKSLAEFIEGDKAAFVAETPDIGITEVEPLFTKDGQRLRSFLFQPKTKGQWERVSYGEEGDFYLVFVVSARTKEGLDRVLADYRQFINRYEKTPNSSLQPTPKDGAAELKR